MQDQVQKLAREIALIKARNKEVSANKAWELSWTRRLLIAVLTYIVIACFFITLSLPKPFINAIIPTTGFLLSTLSIGLVKQLWIHKVYFKPKPWIIPNYKMDTF